MADFSNRLDAHGRDGIKFYATPQALTRDPIHGLIKSKSLLVKQLFRVTPTQINAAIAADRYRRAGFE